MKIIFLTTALLFLNPALKSEPNSDIEFGQPRILEPLNGSGVTAGYVLISNNSNSPVSISLKSVDGFKKAEIHESSLDKDGNMKMEMMETLKVPSKSTVKFENGGKHIMLFDPVTPIKNGSSIKASFLINNQVRVVEFKVIER